MAIRSSSRMRSMVTINRKEWNCHQVLAVRSGMEHCDEAMSLDED